MTKYDIFYIDMLILCVFIGNKKDQWIAVDLLTGHKTETLSMEGSQRVCPSSSEHLLYIGRTGCFILSHLLVNISYDVVHMCIKLYAYIHIYSLSNISNLIEISSTNMAW